MKVIQRFTKQGLTVNKNVIGHILWKDGLKLSEKK